MQYRFKNLPNSIMGVEAILNHEEFLNYYQPVYDAALSVVAIKGFRPGTAPKDLADKVIDKDKVFTEAVNNAAQAVLKEIIEEKNWQLIDQTKVEVLESEPAQNIGLKFRATLTVFPEVELGDYKKIARRVLKEKKAISISDAEVKKS